MLEIRRKLTKVRKDRAEEMMRVMKDYDENVFNPAIKAVQDECAALGHGRTEFRSNGVGWNWNKCCDCDARVEEWSDEDVKKAGERMRKEKS